MSIASSEPSVETATFYNVLNRALIETMERPGICDDLAMQKTIREIGHGYIDMLLVKAEQQEAIRQKHKTRILPVSDRAGHDNVRRDHFLNEEHSARIRMHLVRHTEESINLLAEKYPDALSTYIRKDVSPAAAKDIESDQTTEHRKNKAHGVVTWNPDDADDRKKAARIIVGHVIKAVTRDVLAVKLDDSSSVYVPRYATSEGGLAELMNIQRRMLGLSPTASTDDSLER